MQTRSMRKNLTYIMEGVAAIVFGIARYSVSHHKKHRLQHQSGYSAANPQPAVQDEQKNETKREQSLVPVYIKTRSSYPFFSGEKRHKDSVRCKQLHGRNSTDTIRRGEMRSPMLLDQGQRKERRLSLCSHYLAELVTMYRTKSQAAIFCAKMRAYQSNGWR